LNLPSLQVYCDRRRIEQVLIDNVIRYANVGTLYSIKLDWTVLGLAVVQAIVVAHKGLIKYDNLENSSVFSLVFPMKID